MDKQRKARNERRLTLSQFENAIQSLSVGQRTIDIAKAVLVDGLRQRDQAANYGITGGAVSQIVKKVWDAAQDAAQDAKIPAGYEEITVVLPEQRAFLVKKWASEAEKSLGVKL